MWFASLASYQNQPWLIHLAVRLMHNEPAVLALFSHNPFPHEPPRYVCGVVMVAWSYLSLVGSAHGRFCIVLVLGGVLCIG